MKDSPAKPGEDTAKNGTFRKGRHLPGTDGACDVLTTGVRKVRLHADRVNPLREILLVSGKSGLGKTFAVRRYLEDIDIPYVMLTLTVGATSKEVLSRLMTVLTGHAIKGSAWELRDELRGILAEQQRIVLIDECTNLSSGALNTLRSLHDEDTANFSLYLCGSAAEQVSARVPAMGDRIGGQVHFRPYSETEMTGYLHAYHQVFRDTTKPVLHYLYKDYAGGKFRAWARILQAALPLLSKRGQDGLDRELAALVVQAIRLPSTRPSRHIDADPVAAGLTPTPVAELIAASFGTTLSTSERAGIASRRPDA